MRFFEEEEEPEQVQNVLFHFLFTFKKLLPYYVIGCLVLLSKYGVYDVPLFCRHVTFTVLLLGKTYSKKKQWTAPWGI